MSEKEIFDFIHKQVNALSPLLIECDKQKLQESKRLFDTFVSTLSEQTREQATQKDIFTIALCSQSHKAKATLLEALRIHFKEPSKRKQQEQFISRYNHLQERIKAMKALMQKAQKQLEDLSLELENLTQQYALECARFWGKMKSSLGLSKTKKLIIKAGCKQARAQRALLASAQIDIYTQARKVALPELMRICDGASTTLDSTKETATYTIALHNKTLQLIDIPSFTSTEENLSKETARALQQAHCVLLVVSDTIKDSTLNMIKQGLGEQAQVYVVLDKSAKTPNTLKPINSTIPQTKAVIQKLKDSLGQSYAGAKSLYTLPALLSQASCLIASHDLSAATQGKDNLLTQEIQDHFLSRYKDSCSDSKSCQKQRLSDDSGFSDLAAFLASIIDSRASTQQACDNAYALLQDFGKVVDKIASNYEEFFNAATHRALAQSILPPQEINRLSRMISYGLIAPITQIQEQIHSTISSYEQANLAHSPSLTASST